MTAVYVQKVLRGPSVFEEVYLFGNIFNFVADITNSIPSSAIRIRIFCLGPGAGRERDRMLDGMKLWK